MSTATETRERPILFNADMVRAIIENRKTQTRRIINPQPRWSEKHGWLRSCGRGRYDSNKRLEQHFEKSDGEGKMLHQREYEMPVEDWLMGFSKWKVGDHLWVRENFRIHDADGTKRGISYNADPEDSAATWLESGEPWESAIEAMGINAFGKFEPNGNSRPSIHMPRWASRLTLEVASVRVERLNNISSGDARAEGIDTVDGLDLARTADRQKWVTRYHVLWDKINGAGAWERNPFVFVIAFKKLEAKS